MTERFIYVDTQPDFCVSFEFIFFAKSTFFHAEKSSSSAKNYFFSRSGKSHEKPDLDVPRWMGAHLTYLELSAGKDKQVNAF
jgi:hypothetical protein